MCPAGLLCPSLEQHRSVVNSNPVGDWAEDEYSVSRVCVIKRIGTVECVIVISCICVFV